MMDIVFSKTHLIFKEGEYFMILYYYCSYDGSPVGFNIGSIEASSVKISTELNESTIPEFIKDCFESGIVREAAGKLPNQDVNQYFALKKNMTAEKNNKKYYINIAVVYNYDDMRINQPSQVISRNFQKKICNTIIPSDSNKFGYTVCGDLKEIANQLINSVKHDKISDDDTYLHIISEKYTNDYIMTELNLEEYCKSNYMCLINGNNGQIYVKKKQILRIVKNHKFIILSTIAILATIMALKLII